MNEDKKDNQEPMPVVNVTVEEPSPEPSSEAQPDASQADDVPSLQQLIRDNVTEEDTSFLKSNVSLKQILWGDFLTAEIVRRQIWLILLVVFFVIVYIAQRYSYQKYMLEIDKKTAILKDAKFNTYMYQLVELMSMISHTGTGESWDKAIQVRSASDALLVEQHWHETAREAILSSREQQHVGKTYQVLRIKDSVGAKERERYYLLRPTNNSSDK